MIQKIINAERSLKLFYIFDETFKIFIEWNFEYFMYENASTVKKAINFVVSFVFENVYVFKLLFKTKKK